MEPTPLALYPARLFMSGEIKYASMEDMFFYDGPTFIGGGSYETVATYRNTGMPMAIVQENIGLIGCHPESEEFWYDSYSWMKGKYHGGQQHKLLLNFANELMER